MRVLAALCLVAIAVGILSFAMMENVSGNRDFISYWAAGRQLAHHLDPYDGPAILRLEKSAGFAHDQPFFMRNLPTAFYLAAPLGLLSPRAAATVWSLAVMGALMASIRLLWIMHGRTEGRLHLIGYCFAPAVACVLAGQMGAFLLLGVVLFLCLYAARPFAAGASLMLLALALKPHLFLPFEAVLFAWTVTNRAYRFVLGAGAALAASWALAYWLDPAAWQQYARMAAAAKLQDEFIPTFSLMLRLAIDRSLVWLQFLPTFVATLWAVWYFWRRRTGWSWTSDGLLLLLASVAAAPYAWFTDEVVVLPAILAALYLAEESGRSLLPFGCLAGVALIEVLFGLGINSGFYVWTAPAWLACYLWMTRPLPQPIPASSPAG